MSDLFAQAEGERAQANLIRIGRVLEVKFDHEDGPRARMAFAGLESEWLPWGVHRAGGTRTASTPTLGEQRLVFSPYGDTAQAVIGQAIYQDDFPVPAEAETVEAVEFSDGTRVEYDTETHALKITVEGGPVEIKADTAKIDAPETTITGNLTVEGNTTFSGGSVTHGGKNIGKTHTHSGVQGGSGTTGGPT